MPFPQVVILGAGKIGRGFIGHVLWHSHLTWTFIDANDSLVEQMQSRRAYSVVVLASEPLWRRIEGFEAFRWEDPEAVRRIEAADLIFTAIGGVRLASLAESLAPVLARRLRKRPEAPVNVVFCENWSQPAALLRAALEARLPQEVVPSFQQSVGLVESMVLRSCIEATPEQQSLDELCVQVQDYWELPVDQTAWRGPWPEIVGLKATPNFERMLERKLYTYNAASATIAFLGTLLGYRYLADAARDARVLAVTRAVLEESGQAVVHHYGFDPKDQAAFAAAALAKYQDPRIPDTLERNVRDPIRKLGKQDRLLGPARLALDAGITPHALAFTIAAALRYREPQDPKAVELAQWETTHGVDWVLKRVMGLDPNEPLSVLIKQAAPWVDQFIADGRWRTG